MLKIGIIIHSHTGNTLSVAQKLKEKLLAEGHSVSLEQVIAVDDQQVNQAKVEFANKPELDAYDVLIFGAPVRAFSLSAIMAAYLTQAASMQGKKVGCFMTQQFPYPWLGGNRSIRQMKNLCEAKDAQVVATGVVNWSSKQRQEKISDTVQKLSHVAN
ncbi:MAG: flavodoxin family protein [Peptococcia bacterium]|jgi:flavodoxin